MCAQYNRAGGKQAKAPLKIEASLKIGIDFGTTYSGVAWASTATPDEINVIQQWPSGGNATSDKVPTELKYMDTYPSPGYKWGFDVQNEPERLSWFKLLLDPSLDPNCDDLLAKSAALIPRNKRPVDLVTDYLTAIKKHTLEVLENKLGKAVMNNISIEYVLTVPAVWNDAAKALTLQAAEAVGLGKRNTIRLISEPEAAAVYSLRVIESSQLGVGDTFVIADCGGGTVDLISYEIVALAPKLEVREFVVGTGGMCGSSYLNRRFLTWVEFRIGSDKFKRQTPRSRMHMMKHFEDTLKRSFADDEGTNTFYCPVPGMVDNAQAGVEDGFLSVSRGDMKGIFDPIINQIVSLVEEQIWSVETMKRKVSAVLLVGGFGSSEYLRKRLEASVCKKRKIPLLQPVNAWTAVVNGACQRGLEGLSIVSTTISRRHYGVLCDYVYDPNRFQNLAPGRKYFCRVTNVAKVSDCIHWYINKGGIMPGKTAVSMPFTRDVGVESQMRFEDTLLACTADYTPDWSKDPTVRELCRLETDLSAVPRHLFQKQVTKAGKPFYHISYNITLRSDPQLIFAFEFQGKVYNSITVDFS